MDRNVSRDMDGPPLLGDKNYRGQPMTDPTGMVLNTLESKQLSRLRSFDLITIETHGLYRSIIDFYSTPLFDSNLVTIFTRFFYSSNLLVLGIKVVCFNNNSVVNKLNHHIIDVYSITTFSSTSTIRILDRFRNHLQ